MFTPEIDIGSTQYQFSPSIIDGVLVVNGSFQGVAWSPTLRLFVAVGALGGSAPGTTYIYTSLDGVTWTSRTPPTHAVVYFDVIWVEDLGLFVACGGNGNAVTNGTDNIATSPDGINWTGQDVPNGSLWDGIDYSPELGLIVIVSFDNSGGSSTGKIAYSSDGVNWTMASSVPSIYHLNSVAWSPSLGLFVATSFSSSDTTNRFFSSPDGDVWTARACATDSVIWEHIEWSETVGLFVAVGLRSLSGGTPAINTSPDGINWTSRSAGGLIGNRSIQNVLWIAEVGLFLAVYRDGGAGANGDFLTSPDGINWTVNEGGLGSMFNISWKDLAWSPELGKVVSVCANPSRGDDVLHFTKVPVN